MCGIAGIVPAPSGCLDASLVPRLLHCLEHRGPDDLGWLQDSPEGVKLHREPGGQEPIRGVVLLHRRLSILDLTSSGWQPMATPDDRYYIVFNGEIYNYLELRCELQALGHRFRSQSDTEVLLAAYAQWGSQALTRLVGMFAFAILDTQERKLFLARDFFGIKPLYYASGPAGFMFASEIKALLELPGVSRRVNPERLYLYMVFGVTDHGSETLFSDIHQLPPAHYLEVPLDSPRVNPPVRYWDVDVKPARQIPFAEAAERLREIFLKSVRLHLRSDVPVGTALSGGIDSTAIVMAMRSLAGKDLELHAFSYVADDKEVDEEKWIDLAGQAAGAMVHKVRLDAREMVADLDRLIWIQEEPVCSTSLYAQYRVMRLAQEAGIKVLLDGQGADEVLGGYRYYMAARLASLLRAGQWVQAARFFRQASMYPDVGKSWLSAWTAGVLLPPKFHTVLRHWVGKPLDPHWLNMAWFDERGVAPSVVNHVEGKDVLKRFLYRTLTETSLPHLLRYEDRNSMAFSIESRVPFLTPELVNFVFSLPERSIIDDCAQPKAVFREAMRGIVPDNIVDRRDKIGFATPENKWLETLRPWVERTLRSDAAVAIPVLHLKEVGREWAAARGRAQFDPRVWRWINLIEWSRQFEVRFD